MYAKSAVAALFIVAASVAEGRLARRQFNFGDLGSIQCNIARFRIVGALRQTGNAVDEIEDPDTQAEAQAGLDQAQGGVQQIAQAIFAGEAPPQESREEVEAGLTAVGDALSNGDNEDIAVADAIEALDDSVKAGQDVVSEC